MATAPGLTPASAAPAGGGARVWIYRQFVERIFVVRGASEGQYLDEAQPAADSVMLTVNVPADAKVFVNGRATTSAGELRQYTSAGLQPDAAYRYRVRAEFVRDGKPVSEEKSVSIVTGQTASLAFDAAPEAQVAGAAASAQR